jgi:arsenate reductase (glutaredoxin)
MLILHNPRCSKSREALSLLKEASCSFEVRDYMKKHLSREELITLLKQLGLKASELVRKKEEIYKTLFSEQEPSEVKILSAMLKYPQLIERPIVIQGNKAVIGRPASRILALK